MLVSVERAVDKEESPDTLLLVSVERAVLKDTSPDSRVLVSVERAVDKETSPDTLLLVSVERDVNILIPLTTILLVTERLLQEPSLKYKLFTCKSTKPLLLTLFPLKSELSVVYWIV